MGHEPPRVYYRFIPTYMGNAQQEANEAHAEEVHPHVHGERTFARTPAPANAGSSPRTWGTPTPRYYRRPEARFIPTYMGNAAIPSRSNAVPAVHPHVHEERSYSVVPIGTDAGSSPRTWGTQRSMVSRVRILRFIPTYMGNAGIVCSPEKFWSVHPHVHGERNTHTAIVNPRDGSSPRTWGTRAYSSRDRREIRFIPTYMGNAQHPTER